MICRIETKCTVSGSVATNDPWAPIESSPNAMLAAPAGWFILHVKRAAVM